MEIIKRQHFYKSHDWLTDENGLIDEDGFRSETHHGIFCERCGESICVECHPDYAQQDYQNKCFRKWLECPHCHSPQIRKSDHFCSMCGKPIEYNEHTPTKITYE